MARVACTLDDLLAAARDRLVAAQAVKSASCAAVVDEPDDLAANAPPGEQFCAVTFESVDQPADAVTTDADPLELPYCEATLLVACYVRSLVDVAGRGDAVLGSGRQGASPFVRKVVAALNEHSLLNGSGDDLTMAPLTFLGVRRRGRAPRATPTRRYDCRFSVAFRWRLNEPNP